MTDQEAGDTKDETSSPPKTRLPADISSDSRGQSTKDARTQSGDEKKRFTLAHYVQMEDLTWTNTETRAELQNLRWTLRSKHEEAQQRAREAGWRGFWLTLIAGFISILGVAGLAYGWTRIDSYITLNDKTNTYEIPDRLWELALATTTTLVLIGAAATLLFRVAKTAYDQKAHHERAADFTRQIEVAVRLSLCGSTEAGMDREVAKAMRELAIELVKRHEITAATEQIPDGPNPIEVLREARALASGAKAPSHE